MECPLNFSFMVTLGRCICKSLLAYNTKDPFCILDVQKPPYDGVLVMIVCILITEYKQSSAPFIL